MYRHLPNEFIRIRILIWRSRLRHTLSYTIICKCSQEVPVSTNAATSVAIYSIAVVLLLAKLLSLLVPGSWQFSLLFTIIIVASIKQLCDNNSRFSFPEYIDITHWRLMSFIFLVIFFCLCFKSRSKPKPKPDGDATATKDALTRGALSIFQEIPSCSNWLAPV